MNFVWEMALKLGDKPKERERLFFKQAKQYSSYYEQAFLCINEDHIEELVIELNALYRFDDIFGELLSPRLDDTVDTRTYLYDCIIHFLIEIDLYHGLNKRFLYSRKIQDDLLKNQYGKKIGETFGTYPVKVQRQLSEFLLIQYEVGASILLFTKVIKAIFPNAITYKSTIHPKQILVYLGEEEVDANQKLVLFIIESFLPITFKVRLFWEYHFGILDIDATLKLGEIEII